MSRRPRLLLLLCLLLSASLLPPLIKLSSSRPAALKAVPDLTRLAPTGFADWQSEPDSPLAVVDPESLKSMEKSYEQTVSRVYRHRSGPRIMLMLAYGSNQLTQRTEAHQPEYCYAAHGFAVQQLGRHPLKLPSGNIPSIRLLAEKQNRHELVTYWLTLDGRVVIPGWHRKFEQIRLSLLARPSGGMLVRISSLGQASTSAVADFSSHQQFASDWLAALAAAPDIR